MTVDNALRRRVFQILLPAGWRAHPRHAEGGGRMCELLPYCIIPYARGPIRSLSISEAGTVPPPGGGGYREVVLTGIEISSWGAERRTA